MHAFIILFFFEKIMIYKRKSMSDSIMIFFSFDETSSFTPSIIQNFPSVSKNVPCKFNSNNVRYATPKQNSVKACCFISKTIYIKISWMQTLVINTKIKNFTLYWSWEDIWILQDLTIWPTSWNTNKVFKLDILQKYIQ